MRAGSRSPAWPLPPLCDRDLMVRRARGRTPHPLFPARRLRSGLRCFSPTAPGKRPGCGGEASRRKLLAGGDGNREVQGAPGSFPSWRGERAILHLQLPVLFAALLEVIVGQWWGTVRQRPRRRRLPRETARGTKAAAGVWWLPWIEGGKAISCRVVGAFYLSNWSLVAFVVAV